MYHWYKNAEVCYVYLSDVSASALPHPVHPTVSTFETSRWFTRGWALQELIASSTAVFYSKEWKQIGTKAELTHYLEDITGIDVLALEGKSLDAFSVARRMSWAAKRETTRIEDTGYCLMGIFDINMPLLYGEGEKAFIRLQEEIMKTSDDQSLFAWALDKNSSQSTSGLLARSPAHFAKSGDIYPQGMWSRSEPFYMTNKGLFVQLFLVEYHNSSNNIYYACLNCFTPPGNSSSTNSPAIALKLVSEVGHGSQYVRTELGTLYTVARNDKIGGEYRSLYVRQRGHWDLQKPEERESYASFCFQGLDGYSVADAIPFDGWDSQPEVFTLKHGQIGTLVLDGYTENIKCRLRLSFKTSADGIALCRVLDETDKESEAKGFDWVSACVLTGVNGTQSHLTVRVRSAVAFGPCPSVFRSE